MELTLEQAVKLAEKALERKRKAYDNYMNTPLKKLSPAQIWNEFSHSNMRIR